MSRTMKGAKGAGFEYWSPRPGNKGSDAIGATAKKMMTCLSETEAMERLLSPEMQAEMTSEADLVSLQIEADLEARGIRTCPDGADH